MKIGIASDHRGYKTKSKIIRYLKRKKIEFIDFGTNDTNSVDYNDFAIKVTDAINSGEITNGILVCGTGIGMSIVANKVKGIMCAKVDNAKEARLCKEHNNANVISLSSSLSFFEVKDIIDAYIKAKFKDEERYKRRIDKIKSLETSYSNKEKNNISKAVKKIKTSSVNKKYKKNNSKNEEDNK